MAAIHQGPIRVSEIFESGQSRRAGLEVPSGLCGRRDLGVRSAGIVANDPTPP